MEILCFFKYTTDYEKNNLKNIHRTIAVLLTLALLVSCDRPTRITKTFLWNEDVKELTGGKLYTWLQKAPFDNELDRYKEGAVVITSANQVFPFKARYYSTLEQLGRYYSTDLILWVTGIWK